MSKVQITDLFESGRAAFKFDGAWEVNTIYNNYPDVAAVIGPDAVGLLNHYFAYGYSEGRLPYYGAEPCTDVQTSF